MKPNPPLPRETQPEMHDHPPSYVDFPKYVGKPRTPLRYFEERAGRDRLLEPEPHVTGPGDIPEGQL